MSKFTTYEGKSLEELLPLLEDLASRQCDGHLTLMKFTGGWKVFLGTPLIDGGEGRDQLSSEIRYNSLRDGIISLLNNPHSI